MSSAISNNGIRERVTSKKITTSRINTRSLERIIIIAAVQIVSSMLAINLELPAILVGSHTLCI